MPLDTSAAEALASSWTLKIIYALLPSADADSPSPALVSALAVPSLALAAPTRRVTSFQSQVVTEGRQSFLRIEIGMNGPINDYVVKGDGILNPNRLTIDVDHAEKGDVRSEILLDRQYAKTLRFLETGKKLRITVGMQTPAEERNYRVYTLAR